MQSRSILFLFGWVLFPAYLFASEVTMYKHPQCGCCEKWADHLRTQGFQVTSQASYSMQQIKNQVGLPSELRSCHTAVINGFIVEGHVPGTVVARFLSAPPAGARGLAVPNMPLGSPGMEHPTQKDAYDVLWFDQRGQAHVFEHIDD